MKKTDSAIFGNIEGKYFKGASLHPSIEISEVGLWMFVLRHMVAEIDLD